MNVYITSTPEFDRDTVKEVALILNEVSGEMEFLIEDPFEVDEYSAVHQKMKSIKDIDFLHFEEFFELCKTYRTYRKMIRNNDYVVLITSIKNHKDWFSAFSRENIFIYGEEWEHYTPREAKYGIAYQVIENIFQSEIGLDINNSQSEGNIHDPSIGCIDDFCAEKTDIMLKLRTADICESCYQRAIERNINPLILDQIIRTIENLRRQFILSMRVNAIVKPEKLHIDSLRSVTIGSKNVTLDPLNKVVFIFFLQNLEGVETKLIGKYSNELKRIYKEVRNNPDFDVIERMVDIKNSTFRTVKTRLNKELNKQLGPNLAEYYLLVKVEIRDRMNKYKINLDKEYITIEPPKEDWQL